MQVHANVAEADIGKLRGDVRVTFSVDAYPQQVFPGTVRQLRDNAQTLQNVVTYDAVIDVDNTQGLLKPGMTANVSVVYAERKDVLRVSNAALRYKPSRATLAAARISDVPQRLATSERAVWLSRAGTLTPVIVTIGITDGVYTEVTAGQIAASELAVVESDAGEGQAGP
jgi:HlyD family secretion protein